MQEEWVTALTLTGMGEYTVKTDYGSQIQNLIMCNIPAWEEQGLVNVLAVSNEAQELPV